MTEAAALQTERLRLNNDGAWVELWTIQTGTSTAMYVTSNNESVTFGGNRYDPYPMTRAEIERDSDGNISDVTVTVSNVGREITTNASALRGKSVTLNITNTNYLSSSYSYTFTIKDITLSDVFATIRLGSVNLLTLDFPRERFMRTRCGWVFGSTGCGYDTTRSGALSTCDQTLNGSNGCVAHGTDEVSAGRPRLHPLRFRGFPGIMKGPFA